MSRTDTIERLRFTITGARTVGLTSRTFQNVLLTQACPQQPVERSLEVLTHRLVPPNDGGLAVGRGVVAGLAAVRVVSSSNRE
jgi:hydrogenase maturation protein HypF